MKKQYLKPRSPQFLIDKYKGIRLPNADRDKEFSPIHDGIMSAINRNLKEYCEIDIYKGVWMSSLFPERLTKEILRLIEEHENPRCYLDFGEHLQKELGCFVSTEHLQQEIDSFKDK